jgi:hypothetical protein
LDRRRKRMPQENEKKGKPQEGAEKAGETIGKGARKGFKAVKDFGKGVKRGVEREEKKD